MNNSGHALTTSDMDAVRKAQQEWRLQKRRELEAKARKKQFRSSGSAVAHPQINNQHRSPLSATASPLANHAAISQSHTTAHSFYSRQSPSGQAILAGPQPNPTLFVTPGADPNVDSASQQESVAQQVLREKAIQQQAQLQQMQHAPQNVLSQQIGMQRLFRAQHQHNQPMISTTAALITTSAGVSIQPQASTHISARPVAPRPAGDVNMQNAVEAAAAAANVASVAEVALRSDVDDRAAQARYMGLEAAKMNRSMGLAIDPATARATEEVAAAAAAAAAHAAANAAPGDHQFAALLPTSAPNISTAKSAQEAVDAAAAAAVAAASAGIPGSSLNITHAVDEATRIKLEQLEAQRQWREEKRREIALKRAKGAGSKRGRKRTKFVHCASMGQEQVIGQPDVVNVAGSASHGITTSSAGALHAGITVTNQMTGITGSPNLYPARRVGPVLLTSAQRLRMPSGMQSDSHMATIPLGVHGGFLTAGQSSISHLSPPSTGPSGTSPAAVPDGHITAEDAAVMYAHMTGASAGSSGLPIDSGGNASLPLASSGVALEDVDVVHVSDVPEAGVTEVALSGANSGAAETGGVEEVSVAVGAPGNGIGTDMTRATEAAAVEATGPGGATGTVTEETTAVVSVRGVGPDEEREAMETTETGDRRTAPHAEDGNEPIPQDSVQELPGEACNAGNRHQDIQTKEVSENADIMLPTNAEVADISEGKEERTETETGGNQGSGDDDGVVVAHGVAEPGAADEADGNEANHIVHDNVEGAEAKDEDEGTQDRFQEEGGEDIMTAAAWQSLDSIDP